MTFTQFGFFCVFAIISRAFGHGALTKPMPRLVSGQEYCPWCVGEHQPVTNPSGSVHRDAEPSTPCLGSQPGDAPYTSTRYSSYSSHAAAAEATYTGGGAMQTRIVLDADHNGDAIFQYCPHSEAQTEKCFRDRPLSDWEDVHSYWDATNTDDHWKSGQTFPQTVDLPADMPSGPVSIRWLWVCKYTDEIFVSCLDTEIVGGSSTTAAPTTATVTTTGPPSTECIWTEPPVELQRSPREEKEGRVCWDYTVPVGTKVYYKSKTDIYINWNSEACCLSAADTYGSDARSSDTNIVVFTPTGNFGFCECTAWDPSNPGSCAGEATATNMICPVQGAQKEMCEGAAYWDGLPVNCGGSSTGSTTSTTSQSGSVTTTLSGAGCCYWDANRGCEGNDFCDQSKSNCEDTCQGTWKPESATTTSTTDTLSTTVTTTTTTVTTTPGVTTASTTYSSSGFEPVDGGVDRVCRGASPTDNHPDYFIVKSVTSLDECKQRCVATNGCVGIEHINTRCEIWTRPEGIGASSSGVGYTCLRYLGGSTTTPNPSHSCGQLHDRCGGQDYLGSTCCVSGLKCEYKDISFSQCILDESNSASCGQIWQQCGGKGWSGFNCCVEGLTCVWGNDYYSQCLRTPGSLLEEAKPKRSRLRKSRQTVLESRPSFVQRSSKITTVSLEL